MALKMNNDLKNTQGRKKRKFQRTGRDVKLAFPEGNENEMDADFLNQMYQKRRKKFTKRKKKLTMLQKKQRYRVKKNIEYSYGKILDDEYEVEEDYF